jgi:hypothetical protein
MAATKRFSPYGSGKGGLLIKTTQPKRPMPRKIYKAFSQASSHCIGSPLLLRSEAPSDPQEGDQVQDSPHPSRT